MVIHQRWTNFYCFYTWFVVSVMSVLKMTNDVPSQVPFGRLSQQIQPKGPLGRGSPSLLVFQNQCHMRVVTAIFSRSVGAHFSLLPFSSRICNISARRRLDGWFHPPITLLPQVSQLCNRSLTPGRARRQRGSPRAIACGAVTIKKPSDTFRKL